MIHLKYTIHLFGVILFICQHVFAQPNTTVFEHLTTNEGLSHNSVTSICQDKDGFMWIGTIDGLNRYDGIQFKKFKNLPSRIYQNVNPLFPDTFGNIWFGQRITKYNPALDRYQNNWLYNRDGLFWSRTVTDLTFGSDQKIYVSRDNCIYSKYTDSSDSVFHKVFDHDYKPPFKRINCIRFDSEEQLWLGTDLGMFILNLPNSEVSYFNSIDYPDQKYVQDFLFDSDDNLWLAFTNELIEYNFRNKNTVKYKLPGIGNPILTDIYETKNGLIWVGTAEQGVFYLDKEKGHFKCLLDQANISSLFEDRSHRLWIGTENSGVYIYDSLRNYFNQIPLTLQKKPRLMFHCDVISNHENKGLWIGSRSYGLSYYDFKTKNTTVIDSLNNQLDVIYEDKTGKVWYNHLEYLLCYNPSKKTITKIRHPIPNQFPEWNASNTLTQIIPYNCSVRNKIWVERD